MSLRCVLNRHLDAASVLPDHGADVDLGEQNGRVPLVSTNGRRNLEAMRLLFERGATRTCRMVHSGFCHITHRTMDDLKSYDWVL